MPFEYGGVVTKSIPGQSYNDNQEVAIQWASRYASGVNTPIMGLYTEAMLRGMIFTATTLVAGTEIPVNTSTAPTFILWNPADSGKVVIPIAFRMGFVSLTTAVAAGIGYNKLTGTGGGRQGTSAVITAFTDIVPQSTLIGSSAACHARFATTATIVTTNATFFRTSGLSQGAPLTSTAAIYMLSDFFEGAVGLRPGTAIYPVGNADPLVVTQMTMDFMEIPL